jgi:hypothetical protein
MNMCKANQHQHQQQSHEWDINDNHIPKVSYFK